MHTLIAPLALIVERFAGYPPGLLKLIGHPVMWFGLLIERLERRFNRPQASRRARALGGVLMAALLVLAAAIPAIVVSTLLARMPMGWILEALLATPLLAQKELRRAVLAVAVALERSLPEGRAAVAEIVGRDTGALDEAGVSRAAIESLAESTSDGVVAPLFWLLALGLPGIAIYKAVNTADSMVGHRTERFEAFGWASARLDDVLNWIPARLTALLVAGAALFVPGAEGERAWGTALADARRHASPNAGWPEAAFAGALGFSLGGPRSYAGEAVHLPLFGRGRYELGPADIRLALRLYRAVLDLLVAAALLIGLAALLRTMAL